MRKFLTMMLVLIGTVVLFAPDAFAQTFLWRYRTHATACNSLTGGKTRDLCHQQSDDTLWKCVPSSGDCDTTGEWVQVGGGAGGGLASTDIDTYAELNTIVADQTLTHNGLIDTFAELDALVADKALINTADTKTITATWNVEGTVNFNGGAKGVIIIGSATTLPATCSVGTLFVDTDADTNGSLYFCRATDTWKEVDDDGGAGGLATEDLDTYAELNTIVADATLTHNGLIDTFAELDAIVADKTLVNAEDAVNISGVREIQDGVDLRFGNDANVTMQYDEATDDQLLIETTTTGATAVTDPLFEFLVPATPTANQQVFGVAKGTQSSNTPLITVDEDGDVEIAGSLTTGGGGSSITFGNGGQLVDAANGNIQLGATTTFDMSTNGTLIIENGTNPTVDAAGKIGLDSTEGQLIVHDGTVQRVLSGRKSIDLVIPLPTDSMSFLFKKARYDFTISNVYGIVDPADTGESVVFDIRECNSTGDSCTTIDAAITADNDGAQDDGSLSNPTIDADDWVLVDIGTVTSGGTLDNLTISIDFVEDRK